MPCAPRWFARRAQVASIWLAAIAVSPAIALGQPIPPARLSVATDGTQANAASQFIAASRDGRHVLFSSTASNLTPGDTNGAADLFIRDRDTDRDGVLDEPGAVATIRVSEGQAGEQQAGIEVAAHLSPDGRFVLFSTVTALVADDTNGVRDCYLRDRDADGDGIFDEPGAVSVTRVSTGTGGYNANDHSDPASVSPDGRYVVFWSGATNLYERPVTGVHYYRKDRLTGLTTILTVGPDGTPLATPVAVRLSPNGRFAAFGSLTGPPGAVAAWTIRDLTLGTFVTVTPPASSTPANGSTAPVVSPLVFTSSVVYDFSPDSSHVLLSAETVGVLGPFASVGGTLYDYDLASGRIVRSFPGVARSVFGDGSLQATVSNTGVDYASGSATAVCGALFVPSDAGHLLYRRASGRITQLVTGQINKARSAADGRRLLYEDVPACTGGPLITYLWDAAYGTPLPMPAPVRTGWLDAEGTMVIFGSEDVTILAPGVDTNGFADVFAVDLASRLDRDADGLDDRWEIAMGLDYTSDAGPNGASGDPDGDGQTNLQEFAAATHPRGADRQLLAEGADNAFFKTRLAIANPGTIDATAVVRFDGDDGTSRTRNVHVPPGTRQTVFVDEVDGHAPSFASVIESSVPLVSERTMSWDHTEYGAHAERATPAPATTWFLAEGATGPFSLFYLLQNPGDTAATATIRYLRTAPLPPIEKSYSLPPHSRTTIPVNAQDAALAVGDVSASITATQPILVERAMYRSTPAQPFAAGHDSAGVTAPSTSWFLAEGATGTFFDLFVLLANPNATAADVEIRYLLSTGEVLTKTYTVAAESRRTIWVDEEDFPGQGKALASANVSCAVSVTNAVPIVVERSMWFPSPAMTANYWTEAHNSPGATATATRWILADGEAGGTRGTQTYLLIANTSATPGRVRITELVDSPMAPAAAAQRYQETLDLAPNSRTTVALHDKMPNRRFGVVVESVETTPLAGIVVERAMYWNAGGEIWAAGTSLLATPVP